MAATGQKPRKTTLARLSLGGEAVRAADRADVRNTCASNSHFLLTQKSAKKSLNIVTLPL